MAQNLRSSGVKLLFRHSRPFHTCSIFRAIKLFNEDNSLAPIPSENGNPVNYFELLNLEQKFDQDGRKITRNFKQLQTQLHPDKFASKSQTESELSAEWSSLVNRAYFNVLKPLNRALYMLQLAGDPLREGEIATEVGFLAEVMEVNEEVSEAESRADLAGISEHNKKVLEDYIIKIDKAFSQGQIKVAKKLVSEMKYFSNIQDKIREKETKMGIVDWIVFNELIFYKGLHSEYFSI